MSTSRLPARSTRGKRIAKLLEDEGEEDEEFWNQDAWQEEGADDDYQSESDEEDVVDSDFSDKEESEDDGEVEVRAERRRPALKPPGTKKPVRRQPGGTAKPPVVPRSTSTGAKVQTRTAVTAAGPAPRMLRQSTKQRTAEAYREQEEKEKERLEREKRLKKKPKVEEKTLTQEELLAEAARTEIDNIASLEKMIAREEATKARALATKQKYPGPLIKYRSFRDREESKVTLTLLNMKLPSYMRQKARSSPMQPKCTITGLPAKYRDPLTGQPYANLAAFKQLRQRAASRGIKPGPNALGESPQQDAHGTKSTTLHDIYKMFRPVAVQPAFPNQQDISAFQDGPSGEARC
mmetsp:Transcript_28631/g.80639  ORF Transcript_28631/g.80639 Transcript_28631/m.80639 type:complete len:350 (-) Transcript_28631:331-1380(-)